MIKKVYFLYLFIFIVCSFQGLGQLRLPVLIQNGMVLQRNTIVPVYGWHEPGEYVQVHFTDTVYHTRTDENGRWQVNLKSMEAGGPYTLKVISGDTIFIENILAGDVWILSGQSQMDMDMNRVRPLFEEDIKNAGNSYIRYFAVPTVYNFKSPQADLPSGKWESISTKNILNISAIAWFFADELYRQYKVPVGIVRASLGGSPAEAWMSEDAIREFPEHAREAQRYKDDNLIRQIEETDRQRSAEWYATLNDADKGYNNPLLKWSNPATDISGWPEMEIPGYWGDSKLGELNGAIWFRRDIILPDHVEGKPAKLNLGRIVDADSVFVNGSFVGSVSYQYPPRRYEIPEGILKKGQNTIVVRVVSTSGRGGFVPDKPYELLVDGYQTDLRGEWHYQTGAEMAPLPDQTFVRWKPTGLFNGMISPLTSYAIRGVIWYQGESNTGRPEEYARLFPSMITNWRNKWNRGDFPFLFVQLHNFMESYDHPTESNWAKTRESQMQALHLENTAMAVAIDLGEWNDIHPLNKKDVAKRLVLAARKIAYHETDLVSSGPLYHSMKIKKDSIILTFTSAGSGVTTCDMAELKHIAIAGADRNFKWAKATMKDNTIIVHSPEVKKPVAVRYAWADNPEGANLCNREGLPAAPFRTDNW